MTTLENKIRSLPQFLQRWAPLIVAIPLGCGLGFGAALSKGALGELGAVESLPTAKRAIARQVEQFQLDGDRLPRAPQNPQAPAPRHSFAEPSWPTGIINSGQAPLPSQIYTITNQYQQVLRDGYLNVYAGVLKSDPNQGVVIVRRLDKNFQRVPALQDRFLTPRKVGALRLVQAQGNLLTLQASQGASFTFDLNRNLLQSR